MSRSCKVGHSLNTCPALARWELARWGHGKQVANTWMIPNMPHRAEEAAGMLAALARCGYLIRYIICYLISYRIRYSPSAATLTDVSTLTDMAEELALGGRKRTRRRMKTRRRTGRRKM
jgi:hypothetical protein